MAIQPTAERHGHGRSIDSRPPLYLRRSAARAVTEVGWLGKKRQHQESLGGTIKHGIIKNNIIIFPWDNVPFL